MTPPAKWIKATADIAIGTEVLVVRDCNEVLQTVTRSDTWDLGSIGGLVVMVNGISGGYSLDRVYVRAGAL